MRLRHIGAVFVALAGLTGSAQAASILEKNFWLSGPNYDGVLPFCEDPAVTGKVAARFNHTERTFWDSPLTIQGFDSPREIAFRPWGPDYIPRRFCMGRVLTSDGQLRTVSYFIAEDQGPIGVGWGVEYCVSGLDRPLAYAPNCEMARP